MFSKSKESVMADSKIVLVSGAGYNADIPGTSKESGIAPTTLSEWAARAAWS
jgi:hypothetical protein